MVYYTYDGSAEAVEVKKEEWGRGERILGRLYISGTGSFPSVA